MFGIWQSVQVTNEKHARNGQAGTVFATRDDKPNEVAVRFDLDEAVVLVKIADLKAL